MEPVRITKGNSEFRITKCSSGEYVSCASFSFSSFFLAPLFIPFQAGIILPTITSYVLSVQAPCKLRSLSTSHPRYSLSVLFVKSAGITYKDSDVLDGIFIPKTITNPGYRNDWFHCPVNFKSLPPSSWEFDGSHTNKVFFISSLDSIPFSPIH